MLDPSKDANNVRINNALMYAGLDELNPHDRRILDWLAGWEPTTVLAVTNLIEQAWKNGRRYGIAETIARVE